MSYLAGLFELRSLSSAIPLAFALILALILVVSFRSRATVFCQYLKAMTGVELKPAEVRKVFREEGREGVRGLFLELMIREDLKTGPIAIPDMRPAPKR